MTHAIVASQVSKLTTEPDLTKIVRPWKVGEYVNKQNVHYIQSYLIIC